MGVFCASSGLLALICVYYETHFSFSADFWHSVKYVNYHITSFTIASFLYQVNYHDHFLHSDHKLYLCLLHISSQSFWSYSRVSVQGVKSLGGHFACLCRGFKFYKVKKKCYYFSKRKWKYFYTFYHFYSEKSSKRAK